jgi:hypothetical protein
MLSPSWPGDARVCAHAGSLCTPSLAPSVGGLRTVSVTAGYLAWREIRPVGMRLPVSPGGEPPVGRLMTANGKDGYALLQAGLRGSAFSWLSTERPQDVYCRCTVWGGCPHDVEAGFARAPLWCRA